MYFQIPLMVLVITPALEGLRPAWREAAHGLGGGSWTYWRLVGLPVLAPSVLGAVLLLFGSGFSAYATAQALTSGSVSLTPIQIGSFLSGNVLSGQENVGKALGLGMILVIVAGHVAVRPAAAEGVAMAAVAPSGLGGVASAGTLRDPGETPSSGLRRRPPVWRWIILVLAGVYFLVPLYAAARFTLRGQDGKTTFNAYTGITRQLGFGDAASLSLRLAAVTVVITLVLMVPTVVYLHLRLPRFRRVVEAICLLPIVIPPVVLIVGVLEVAPTQLKSTPYLLALQYVILALPFAYRALDAGLAAIDVRTLVDAARSLGTGWVMTLLRVVVPNMRSAVMSATVLTTALVLGEFTLASLDQYQTFPVWVVAFQQDDARVSVAVSLLALLLTWAFLLLLSGLDIRRARRVKNTGEAT